MILMYAKLDNIYGFEDFDICFSYPKKIVNSSIENEWVDGFPNFRYKKINILMGANASGKTTLGKAIMAGFNYIRKNNSLPLIESVNPSTKSGKMILDFVTGDSETEKKTLFRCQISVSKENPEHPNISASLNFTALRNKDSYEIARDRILKQETVFTDDSVKLFERIDGMGWMFNDTDSYLLKYSGDNKKLLDVLSIVLRTFDNSIKEVVPIDPASPDSILIRFSNGQSVVYHNGEFAGKNILSKGTESGISIAEILTSIIEHLYGFYYCDEKFCFVQSDLEIRILSLMIDALGKDEQLIFTTHNSDVLKLNLPKHSFTFLRKTDHIEAINAGDYLKKQSDSLKNAVENDAFSALPDFSELNNKLEELIDEKV